MAICRDPEGFEFVCVQNSTWFKLDRHTVSVAEGGGPEQIEWELESTRERDFKIEYRVPGEEPASVMVFSGFVMLVKGMEVTTLQQIKALEGPVLMSNLALSLLYLSVPAGPEAVMDGESWALMAADDSMPIRVSSPSAALFFGEPWKLSGEAARTGGKISYKLSLEFVEADDYGKVAPDAPEKVLTLEGTWEKLPRPLHYGDDLSIAGWIITTLGPGKVEAEDGTVIDYGKRFREAAPKTVGELRKVIQEAL
jgi:hypothetical protein